MGTSYWVTEYIKVFLAYGLIMLVWPSILFRSYLKGKGRVFWLFFCVSVQMVLISTVVLMLGLFHLLNVWVIRVLFYGSLIWSVSKSVHLEMTPRYLIYKLQNRSYGPKLLLLRLGETLRVMLRKAAGFVRRMVKGNVVELAALAVIVIYGMIYFSYGAFQEHYFGFGDMYVHHAWIYGLEQGQSFSGGVYPEGMHAVIYAIHAVFGIRIYNVLLYLQCVHVATFLLGAYCLIRELFPWHYSGLLVLTGFLTLYLACYDEVFSMSRLQWTIPQEFALYAVFTIPLFLVRYLKHAGPVMRGGKQTRMFWSDDLVVFLLGIAVTVTVHFYTTFMAIFACVGVAVVWCGRLFNWRRLVPVAVSAVLAVVLAVLPMGVAFAEGIPFQSSIYWALGVMEGKYDQSGSTEVIDQSRPTGSEASEAPPSTLGERLNAAAKSIKGEVCNYYGEVFGSVLWYSCLLCAGAWLFWRVLALFLKRTGRYNPLPTELLDGYGTVAFISIVFVVMLSNEALGIPALVTKSRLCAVKHMFLLAVLAVPVDLAGALLARFKSCRAWMMQSMGAAGAVAALYLIVVSGNYHGYLYCEGSRYPAAVEVTNTIIDSIPKDTYTIVSTTDELYQIIGHGYHEEYLTFLENYIEEGYYLPSPYVIPTPYVFFFVEKHPLLYGQRHFFNGPDWLALCRYQDYAKDVSSLCPEMLKGEISDDKADDEIVILGSRLSSEYEVLSNREIVESAAARYIRILQSQYPNNISVYYEDEDFACYCMKQNPARLTELQYPKEG